MRAACMKEVEPSKPVFQQLDAELPGNGNRERSGEAGSARQLVTDFIQQKRLDLPDVHEYTMMWSSLAALTIDSPIAAESRIPVSPEVHQTIVRVSRGLDFVLFDELGKIQKGKGLQKRILTELAEIRQEEGTDRLELSFEEGRLLRDAAAAVNIVYNPGGAEDTPENREKRTFRFTDLERRSALVDPAKVVEADSTPIFDARRAAPNGK